MSYQRDFAKRLDVAVVGVGNHSYRNILPCLTFLPVALRAVCDLDERRARVTAEQYGAPRWYTDAGEMFAQERLDCVFLCVSDLAHPELACRAFEAGLHVWMEKPPAVRAAQVDEMIRRRGDLVSVVGFKKAFMPAAKKVIEILSKEPYGPVQSISGLYPVCFPENGREVLEKALRTPWSANAVHPLSLMVAVGGSVRSVGVFRGGRAGAVCVFHYENGCVGSLHLAASAPRGQPVERYTFVGKNCSIEIDNVQRVTFQRGIPFEYNKTTSFAPPGIDGGAVVWEPQQHLSTLEGKSLFIQGIYDELRYFLDCVAAGERPTVGSLEFALDVMQVYEAASISDGEMVEVEARERQS